MTVNNVTRMLDSKKITYQAFELPEEKISALDTASLLNVSAEIIYKSIVFLRTTPKGKPILAVIPATHEVDAKRLAKAVNEKKVKPATLAEAESLTGLKAGGISPLALLNKGFQIFLAQSASEIDEIHVSGGQLGLNIRLKVKDLIKITGARIAPVSKLIE
jgi:Cys-tRNA(Pro)/Cys-tRNA(Cys) deacylase